jgi:hypothetical protein
MLTLERAGDEGRIIALRDLLCLRNSTLTGTLSDTLGKDFDLCVSLLLLLLLLFLVWKIAARVADADEVCFCGADKLEGRALTTHGLALPSVTTHSGVEALFKSRASELLDMTNVHIS